MRRFWKQVCGPLNSITQQPFHFVVWCIVAIVIGLAGLWLPILLSWSLNKLTFEVFLASVRAGSLASFSVVLLAEGISSALTAQRAGTNLVAAGLRGVVSVVALVVVVIQVGFLGAQSLNADGSVRSAMSQVFVTLLAILFASYLYCFRFASWEKDVEAVREADDQAVQDLAKSAEQVTSDEHGVKL